MSSFNFAKTLSRPLLLVSAALLIHSGGALAAEPSGDAQAQARNLLSGISTQRLNAVGESTVRTASESHAMVLDVQEQARATVSGTRSLGIKSRSVAVRDVKTTAGTMAQASRHVDADAQQQAQRTLLGTTG